EDTLLLIGDADLESLGARPKPGIGMWAAGKGGATRVPMSPASTLKQGKPVAVNGGYAFAMGDPASADPQWIMGENGKPFVLDI
ncbi:hypothetical protein LXA55_18270, partial [Erwinia amylovora]|uniref:hypothetical protein n=1 Tax=Erwinia amylovora TaxID=552 RepID=UPI0020C09661